MNLSHPTIHRFNLMELVIAASILGLVMTGAFSGLHMSRNLHQRYVQEYLAVKVLDNVTERIAGDPGLTVERLGTLLTQEFQRSDLGDKKHWVARSTSVDGAVLLEIVSQAKPGSRLASIEVITK